MFLALYVIAFVVLAVVSIMTYYLFFTKYKNKLNKTSETDINKAKYRLKYCLNCGAELDKKNRCPLCGEKY